MSEDIQKPNQRNFSMMAAQSAQAANPYNSSFLNINRANTERQQRTQQQNDLKNMIKVSRLQANNPALQELKSGAYRLVDSCANVIGGNKISAESIVEDF